MDRIKTLSGSAQLICIETSDKIRMSKSYDEAADILIDFYDINAVDAVKVGENEGMKDKYLSFLRIERTLSQREVMADVKRKRLNESRTLFQKSDF